MGLPISFPVYGGFHSHLGTPIVGWLTMENPMRQWMIWWCNNHLEKYEFVNGKDYPIYEKENKHD